jgi:hypothetical protein
VAAATADERARAERWRGPGAAEAAGFWFRDDEAFRRSGEVMHVWFTGDLATAFARRPPSAALRAADA